MELTERDREEVRQSIRFRLAQRRAGADEVETTINNLTEEDYRGYHEYLLDEGCNNE